jgi:hypothetical protein
MQLSAAGDLTAKAMKQIFRGSSAGELEEHFELMFDLLRAPINTAVEQLKQEEANEQR